MLKKFNSKKNLEVLSIFCLLILSLIYIFSKYYSITKQSSKFLENSIKIKYEIYLKNFDKNKDEKNILIKNPNYIDLNDFIEEYQKSTPLMIEKEKKEINEFDFILKFFTKKDINNELKEKIKILEEKKESYIIESVKHNYLTLYGKVNDYGFIKIKQNVTDFVYLQKENEFFFLLVFIFLTITIGFILYTYNLKIKLNTLSYNLKKEYKTLNNQVKKIAFEDTLTKASSRLKFDETLKDLVQISSRFEEQKFSIVMFDIDNFKKINDTYGHDYGDIVLKELARIVKDNIRASDTFARWGGEEFIVLSPLSNLESAYELAEKLRLKIRQLKFKKLQYITCSFGVAEFQKGDNEESIVKRADTLLYKAKRNGKNQVRKI